MFSDIIIRFSVFSKVEKNFNRLAILKEPDEKTIIGDPIVLLNGRYSGKNNLETAYVYNYRFKKVAKIDECNKMWLMDWQREIVNLKKLKNYGFMMNIDYEITINNSNFPELIFDYVFLRFLGECGITMSMYFYHE